MNYQLEFTPLAIKHLEEWRKSGQIKTIKKIYALLEEISQHPKSGTGQVEQLRGNLSGLWSRRIDKANRIVYSVIDERVIVEVLTIKGHY